MRRDTIKPREDWQKKVEEVGFVFHTPGGHDYWNESAFYTLNNNDVQTLEAATAELYRLFLAAGEYIVAHELFNKLLIPDFIVPYVREAWRKEPPCLNYGRFDLGYDGVSPPKLYEFNCDTPTCLLEAAVVQWKWKEELYPDADQFNSLHEKLVAKWRDISPYLKTQVVHFMHAADPVAEDIMTVSYLRDTAEQAELSTVPLFAAQVGWEPASRRFVDMAETEIRTLFHLYPWEWLVREDFARHIIECTDEMDWIEPAWKMLWSNKAVLAILWELFPNHPNLLGAKFTEPNSKSYVKKPLYGREGRNVTIVKDGKVLHESDGPYGDQGFIFQELHAPQSFDGQVPVLGSWVVDGVPAGIGIREAEGITDNGSLFVPHIIGE